MATKFVRTLFVLGAVASPTLAGTYGQAVAQSPQVRPMPKANSARPMPIPASELTEGVVAGKVDPEAPIEVINERYASGKTKVRREVARDEYGNYIRHGKWEMWDESGNLIATGTFQNNQRHGSWMRVLGKSESKLFAAPQFSEFTGPFVSKAEFDSGKLNGVWTILDHKGNKVVEWQYVDGLRNDTSRQFSVTGKLVRETTYRQGLLDGSVRAWDNDGKLVLDEIYQDGRKLAAQIKVDKDGRKQSEGMYLHAQIVVDKPDDWWNCIPCQYKTVGQDIRHGRWTTWYNNGQKNEEGVYAHDLQDGQFTWWYANGQLKLTGSYKNGAKHGLWVWWHENGQKATEGTYLNDEPHGAWAYWNPDGRLYQKSDFSAESQPSVLGRADEPARINAPPAKTSLKSANEARSR